MRFGSCASQAQSAPRIANDDGTMNPTDPTLPAACDEPTPQPDPRHRAIRTFVKRAGRTTEAQARAWADVGPRFLVPFQPQPLDFTALFGRTAPTVLEIGFGMGEATAHIARVLPEVNFLACEVHEPGIGALLKRIDDLKLSNVRIVAHDAVEVLAQMVPLASLDGFHLFFPDPWHKKRHHKRRLIQPAFVHALIRHLKPGAYIHCATDWEPYARQMLEVLSAEPALRNTAADFAPKPHYRPLTKFENRGLKLGHGVWDLVFIRN